jgi:iron complex outermembrane receptor protein
MIHSAVTRSSAAKKRALFVGAAIAVALGAASGAMAQTAGAGEDAGETTLGELVVTAQKRSERLQDVPVSVNVVSADALAKSHISGLEQLQQLSPSLTFTPSVNTRGQGLSVRGIGTLNFSDGVEPTVSVVVDGVVIGRSAGSFFDFNDVQRIEVLRGPQGMLFGKNAAAGVINIVTARPNLTQMEGDASISYASFNEVRAKGSISVPIKSGELAARLSGFYNESDGIITNVFNGKKYNGLNSYGVRGKVVWSPSDTFDLYATVDYTSADQDCCVGTVRSILPTTRYFGPNGPTRASLFAGVDVGPYSRQANFDGRTFNDQSTWGTSVEMNKDLGGFSLTSITAYRAFEVQDNNDSDGGPLALLNINSAHQKQNQFTQEVRISSPAGERLEYVAGLFYFDQDVSTTTDIKGNFGQVLPAGAFFGNFIDRAISTRNYAAFGQATYNVTDQLRLIGGLRYTNERLDARFKRILTTGAIGGVPGLGGPALNAPKLPAKDDDVSYKLGTQYKFDDSVMVYATYSRGYKGQAINLLNNLSAATVNSGQYALSPETVSNYEIGLRSTPFERKVTFNLTFFQTEFKDFQAQTFDAATTSFALANAGKLRSRGGELETQYSPFRALQFSGNVAYADTRVQDFAPACYPGQTAALGCVGGRQEVTGSGLPNAPMWSYTVGARYNRELENAPFDLTADVSYSYRSSVFFTYSDPNAVQPGYGLLNLNLGLQSKDGRYEVTAFARNLLDKQFVSGIVPGFLDNNASGAGYTQTITQDAFRRIGLEARMHF